jgi:H+/gluconate symporter-like permease
MNIFLGILMVMFYLAVVVMIVRGQSPIIMLLLLTLVWMIMAGVPGEKILANVFEKGGTAFSSSLVAIIFGAWFGQTLVKTGIAESIIRVSLELAGDRPLIVLLVVVVVTSLLFTSLYGVGAAIAIGVIALPIVMSAGIPPELAAAAYSMAIGAGAFVNMVDFSFRVPLFPGIKFQQPLLGFLVAGWAISLLITCLMCICNLKLGGGARKYSSVNTVPISSARAKLRWYAYLAPAVPVFLVIVFKWPMLPAFIVGTVYAIAATHFGQRSMRESVDLFHRAFYDAFPEIATICALWIICGMLIVGAQLPEVQAVLKPIYSPILPTSRLMLCVFFGALAPLAIYRGPLHVIGTGAILVGMFAGAGTFAAVPLFAAWRGTMNVGSSIDPTNSWPLWTIGYTKVTHKQFLRTGLPWIWVSAIVISFVSYFMIP